VQVSDDEGWTELPPPKTPVATIGEAFDVMVEASGVVAHNAARVTKAADYLLKMARIFTRTIIPVVVVLIIGNGLLAYQLSERDNRINQLRKNVESLQKSSEDTKTAAAKAQTASEAAQRALEGAIAQSQMQTQDTSAAITRINDLYAACQARGECK
jgi:hypothetical protein